MKVLIINLARLGDLIQTVGLVKGLARKYRDAKIDFLALSSFASIIEYFEYTNEVIALNDQTILENLENDLWSAYGEIKDKIDYLNSKDYDLIVNPIASIRSALIGYLIRGREKLGMFYNEHREKTITSNCTAFHLSYGHGAGDHTFNLVDIFAGVGGIRADCEQFSIYPSEDARERAKRFWEDNRLTQYKTIGFHIGASNVNRAWKPEKFRSVIDRLIARQQYKVLLFGGYKEEGLTASLSDIKSDYFLNLIGRTNLDELIAFIRKLDIFVSNDTGPMHIAAATGTRMISIFLGPASVWETGPYSNEAIVLEPNIDCHPCKYDSTCSHLNCHDFITPEAVERAIIAYLSDTESLVFTDKIKYWQSTRDTFGLQHFVPVQKRKIRQKELFFELKRCVWALTLFRECGTNENLRDRYLDYLRGHYVVPEYDFGKILPKLELLTTSNTKLANSLRVLSSVQATSARNLNKIRSTWAITKKEKERLFTASSNIPECNDFVTYAKIRESGLSGDNLNCLAMQTANIYFKLGNQLAILTDLVKRSVATPPGEVDHFTFHSDASDESGRATQEACSRSVLR